VRGSINYGMSPEGHVFLLSLVRIIVKNTQSVLRKTLKETDRRGLVLSHVTMIYLNFYKTKEGPEWTF